MKLGGIHKKAVTVGLVALVAAACGSSSKSATPTTATTALAGSAGGANRTASAVGVTPSTITIGFLNDATGVAASDSADSLGAAQAWVDLQNAQGGVNGRQIKIVTADTASSGAGAKTAAQLLDQQKHVFAIAVNSAFTYGATTYMQTQGIPVTGEAYDGQEWGQQPNTNMFSAVPRIRKTPRPRPLGNS